MSPEGRRGEAPRAAPEHGRRRRGHVLAPRRRPERVVIIRRVRACGRVLAPLLLLRRDAYYWWFSLRSSPPRRPSR